MFWLGVFCGIAFFAVFSKLLERVWQNEKYMTMSEFWKKQIWFMEQRNVFEYKLLSEISLIRQNTEASK